MPQKFEEWTIKDPCPGMALQNIQPISHRAFALVSRNKNGLVSKEGALNIIGAIDMMEALDYHFNNFIEHGKGATNINQKHEAVAYLNRLGQLYAFTKSDFTKKYNSEPKAILPKLDELYIFRRKNTAHRSLDAPQNEPKEYRNRQALSLLGATTLKFMGNEQYVFPNYNKDHKETEWQYFTPATDHPIVMEESYQLIEKIITQMLKPTSI
ncbi:hypothetical protein [Arenibacter troitsensis]|uniref:Uncharacterized protein n=1 Tax=Arenibacter troitsensis TaxID=188872 RepID=A0A1X7IVJ0_9FLAO|nr:hypothetical protein [Arenibacter troitsensis]SMG18942.1 hypothetical protein SAMN03080602_01153 [Arenibacter troitsensis]